MVVRVSELQRDRESERGEGRGGGEGVEERELNNLAETVEQDNASIYWHVG